MVDVCSFIVKLFLQHGILLHGSIPIAVNCYLPHVNVNNDFRRISTTLQL